MPLTSNPLSLIILQPVYPTGAAALLFNLIDTGKYYQATGGTGGWQIVDRPKRPAATQWYDRSPWELDMTLMLDSETIYGVAGRSIEYQCQLMETWMDAVPGTLLPPILTITGPVPGLQRQWCVYTLEYDDAIRNPSAGFRTQQSITVALYEYVPATSAIAAGASPAAAAQQTLLAQTSAVSYVLYTVKTGDTLSSIAAKLLNNYAAWTTIAFLNNIRDPNSLIPGELIKVPAPS
jgi:hypothetical protein